MEGMRVVFVERLTGWVWLGMVFPRLLSYRLIGCAQTQCWILEGRPFVIKWARATGAVFGISVHDLKYRMMDVRDEEGLSVYSRVDAQDLQVLLHEVRTEPFLQQICRQFDGSPRSIGFYLCKKLMTPIQSRTTVFRSLLVIQVCVWKAKQLGCVHFPCELYLDERPWFGAIRRYAGRFGFDLRRTPPALDLGRAAGLLLGSRLTEKLRGLLWRVSLEKGHAETFSPGSERGNLRIGTPFYGYLNVESPEKFSDLFFWQQSALRGSDLLVIFDYQKDPLDAAKKAALNRAGIDFVALHPRATVVRETPMFLPRERDFQKRIRIPRAAGMQSERVWSASSLYRYQSMKRYWGEFFERSSVRVFVMWHMFDESHGVIRDALNDQGGIMAVYQRSHDSQPSAQMAVSTDIYFGFSASGLRSGRCPFSQIGTYVMTGYLGDHRFALVRPEAEKLRNRLKKSGARHIMAYMDANSSEDERWGVGHSLTRRYYTFFLEKVLQEPLFGLVIKPKVTSTLRQRLGRVASLLDRALETGRCHILMEGVLRSSNSPSLAALAADVAVHGHLVAGSAGVESALAGVPTLFLDGEGWSRSPLYDLGKDRIVFTDCKTLWKHCEEHWSRPAGLPGFGLWGEKIEQFDPFRDGRAAERMGTYLGWLVEGLRAGLPRQTVMADAAQRYATQWGKDKIMMNCAGATGMVRDIRAVEAS